MEYRSNPRVESSTELAVGRLFHLLKKFMLRFANPCELLIHFIHKTYHRYKHQLASLSVVNEKLNQTAIVLPSLSAKLTCQSKFMLEISSQNSTNNETRLM